eukprot:GHVU01212645.1.p1 GENE.GHVU01212645.1~~GHVU01212645.1.p1  ORF type:complete len:136 (-),score=6.04 GHVU01212645.1:616-1023(-)
MNERMNRMMNRCVSEQMNERTTQSRDPTVCVASPIRGWLLSPTKASHAIGVAAGTDIPTPVARVVVGVILVESGCSVETQCAYMRPCDTPRRRGKSSELQPYAQYCTSRISCIRLTGAPRALNRSIRAAAPRSKR